MKTIIMAANVAGASQSNARAWYFLPDSAISNAGKPFFIPETDTVAEAVLAPVIKINRLGKTIATRFGHRYYSELAPAIHFRLPEVRRRLLEEGLPADMAYSFDRSLIIGDFLPFNPEEKLTMTLNGAECALWKADDAPLSIDEALAAVSSSNTMKMGDIFAPIVSQGVKVEIGDTLEVFLSSLKSCACGEALASSCESPAPILSVKIK